MKCEDKRHYLTREAAETAATRTRLAARGQKLYPYQCPTCSLWHLTTWTPSEQVSRIAAHKEAYARKHQQGTTKVEPPSEKALRTKLTQITAALKLDERRQDAARLKRVETLGKLVAADEALRKAEDEYRAAQAEVLKLLGI